MAGGRAGSCSTSVGVGVLPHVSAGTCAPGLLATPRGRLAQASPAPLDSQGWHAGVQGTGYRTLQVHVALRHCSALAAELWGEVSGCVFQSWAWASCSRQRQGAAVPCATRESFSPSSAGIQEEEAGGLLYLSLSQSFPLSHSVCFSHRRAARGLWAAWLRAQLAETPWGGLG